PKGGAVPEAPVRGIRHSPTVFHKKSWFVSQNHIFVTYVTNKNKNISYFFMYNKYCRFLTGKKGAMK
ncbi:MAG: hypothetical protein PHD63_05220, partial [Candidatus Marinimicrobia bacterium]|nr:hypothetical protein [Candidatus Neomarinimicrobiota bacterium]MDD3966433.1 hypothetical protein [Candidatus Neomarinimicrobiota bacterium]